MIREEYMTPKDFLEQNSHEEISRSIVHQLQNEDRTIGAVIKTPRGGVIDEDSWWLHLYVVMSRATRLDDLLLVGAPPVEFLLRGQPRDLKQRVVMFASRPALGHIECCTN